MLDHVSITVSSFEKSKAFYTAILAPLGVTPQMEFPGGAGFGRTGSGIPAFWIGEGGAPSRGGHVAFQAPSREAVRKFHAAGLAAGGRDEGEPGLRPHYHENYYAAFLWDPDGYKVEAVIHTPE
jgi:catechol 2,3-dioxygenase-like lactoylglutathione lyase family enzyme